MRSRSLFLAIVSCMLCVSSSAFAADTVYVYPAITDARILADTSIADTYTSTTINVSGTPGEFRPATFVIRPSSARSGVTVTASDLTGSAGTIAKSAVDIRVVKIWYQAGGTIYDMNNKQLTPELLLKDDSLVKVENGNNYVKFGNGSYQMVSDRVMRDEYLSTSTWTIKDSATLQPVSIPANSNKQFWVTVAIPANAAAGTYSGTLKVATSSATIATLQLNLEVFGFKLSSARIEHSMYYRGILDDSWPNGTIGQEYKSEAQLRAELKNLRDHGISNPSVTQDYNYYNGKLLKKFLDIKKELGMQMEPLYDYGVYPLGYQSIDSVNGVIDLAKSYGISNVYFFGVDEAEGSRLYDQRSSWNSIRSAGGKLITSAHESCGIYDMRDILSIVISSDFPSASLSTKYHDAGVKIYSYANPQCGMELPETYRRNYGLALWQYNYDGAMDFAYQWDCDGSNPWNDWDYTVNRDHMMTYPTVDGVIDTIQWEGYREGVYDTRYLATLQDAITAAKAAGKSTSDAEAYISTLKNQIVFTNWQTRTCTLADFQTMESIRNTLISKIKALVGGPQQAQVAPVLAAIGAKSGVPGTALIFSVSATDANGDTLTYSATGLPSGAGFNASTRTFSWTPTETGSFTVTFAVSDGKGGSDSEAVAITVGNAPNQAPVLSAIGNKSGVQGAAITFTVSATDANGDTLTYSATGLPSGASFNASTRAFSWPIPATQTTGTYTVTFTVSDGKGANDSEAVVITVGAVANQPPVLNAIGSKSVTQGSSLSFTVSATDPNSDTLVFSVSGLPSGASFSASSRTFSWTPATVGSYTTTFTVSDGKGGTHSETVAITVLAPSTANHAPVMEAIGSQSVIGGQVIDGYINATDADGDTLTYSASGLPAGALFNTSTRKFYWDTTVDQAGTYTVTFKVIDGKGASDSEAVKITVTGPSSGPANHSPVLATIGAQSATPGISLDGYVNATDADGDALTYSASGLPSGASFNTATRFFKWVPASSQTGTYTVTFTVSDGKGGSDSEAVRIMVRASTTKNNRYPVLVKIGSQSVIPGTFLDGYVRATDADGDALTYSASGLPSGASFNASTRFFSWVPTSAQIGTYTVTFKVSDGKGGSDSEAVKIRVLKP